MGNMDYKLVYKPSTSPEPFITYSDADHGGNLDNGKSTGGYVVKIGGVHKAEMQAACLWAICKAIGIIVH